MQQVLVVENSRSVVESIKAAVAEQAGLEAVAARSLAEAREVISAAPRPFLAGVFGLYLEDASGMQVLDFALDMGVPPIIYTAALRPDLRRAMWKRHIVDYLLKDSPQSLSALAALLTRLSRNDRIRVLVAESKKRIRERTARRLAVHNYKVMTTSDGAEALRLVREHPQMRLLVLGDDLENTRPIELLHACRAERSAEELAVISVSVRARLERCIQALKHGADDFLLWPFSYEELYSRVHVALDTVEHLQRLREMAQTDPLTGISNRRHFMQRLGEETARARRHGHPVSVVMLDADHFKKVNDTFGHDVGDEVIRRIVAVIDGLVRSEDVFGRIGGEEFALALPETGADKAMVVAERIRELISRVEVEADKGPVRFTVSCGVGAWAPGGDEPHPEVLLKRADEALYEAKESGRNRVVLHPEDR